MLFDADFERGFTTSPLCKLHEEGMKFQIPNVQRYSTAKNNFIMKLKCFDLWPSSRSFDLRPPVKIRH